MFVSLLDARLTVYREKSDWVVFLGLIIFGLNEIVWNLACNKESTSNGLATRLALELTTNRRVIVNFEGWVFCFVLKN